MFRFSHAAAAIGITEAALRNWMTRNKLDLWGERPEGGWREFKTRDVLVLALVAELVSYGAKVDEAARAVYGALASVPGADPLNFPRYLFAARSRFGGWELHADEGMAFMLASNRSAIKIAPTVICAEASNKLHAAVRADAGKAASTEVAQ